MTLPDALLCYGVNNDVPGRAQNRIGAAYLYDWNMLPIGQLLWMKELGSYREFPPLQAPETYNLDGIMKEMESHKGDD
jgi:arylsulfatase